MTPQALLIGEAAVRLGVPESRLRKAVRNGTIAVSTIGPYRSFPVADLPALRAALVEAGVIPTPAPAAVGG